MTSEEVRKKFLDFFKDRGHVVVPSSPLLSDDPSILLTTAGMQQFKPYYTGAADPYKAIHLTLGRPLNSPNAVSIQKSFRTSDIEEVGDETHHTFFEMLGNFSFGSPEQGGYFKKEAIEWAYEFMAKVLGLKVDYVSVFGGDPSTGSGQGVPADSESEKIWRALGIRDVRQMNREDNFWGPTGKEGPCGPTTEIYVQGIEIWNLVFNEYYSHPDGSLTPLKTPGVDTGMGFERLMMVLNQEKDPYHTDLFLPLLEKIRESAPQLDERTSRIFADHLRAIIFLVADGIPPSNKEAGYILRRLIRRLMAYEIKYDIHPDLFAAAVPTVKKKFAEFYPELKDEERIESVIDEEKTKFKNAIARGVKELGRYETINGSGAFRLYESFGLPYEVIRELAPETATRNLRIEDFDKAFEEHQRASRVGKEKKFGGHGLLLDTGEMKAVDETELKKVTRFHTATHLLQAALRQILGEGVRQMGSDITAERTRFDFSFPRKLRPEEIKEIEDLVNGIIKKDLSVQSITLPLEEAKTTGALYVEGAHYPVRVKVYYVGPSLEEAFSKEICGGPHVTRTGEIGRFRIKKEEAVSGGARRLRAELW